MKMTDKNIHKNEIADMPEDVLVSRIRAGETQAYKYFFWEYCDYINMLTHTLLERQEDAQAVVHAVMQEVWIQRKSPRLKAPLKSYLYQEVYRQSQPYLSGKKERSLMGKLFGM
jgi:DNA-directed RNA polymerase specialized sigma24 family protein